MDPNNLLHDSHAFKGEAHHMDNEIYLLKQHPFWDGKC
jgi:hypothetical protein